MANKLKTGDTAICKTCHRTIVYVVGIWAHAELNDGRSNLHGPHDAIPSAGPPHNSFFDGVPVHSSEFFTTTTASVGDINDLSTVVTEAKKRARESDAKVKALMETLARDVLTEMQANGTIIVFKQSEALERLATTFMRIIDTAVQQQVFKGSM